MEVSLQPTASSVVQLLDSIVTTGWPSSTAECDLVWGPLGVQLAELAECPPGHENLSLVNVHTRLEGPVDGSITSTLDGQPQNLGLMLYASEADDADPKTEVAFDTLTRALTETWGPDTVRERRPGAWVWDVRGHIVEVYHHKRPIHPRTGMPAAPAVIQIGLGSPKPKPAAPPSAT